MALKARYKTLDEIPQEHRSLYVQKDGGFELEVEGMAPKEKVDEFRTNNLALEAKLKEYDAQLARVKDIDPEEYKKLKEQQKELEQKKLLDAGEFDKLFAKKEGELRAEYDTRIKGLNDTLQKTTQERDKAFGDLGTYKVEDELTKTAIALKVRPEAYSDFINRGRSVWSFKDGKVVALDGDKIRYGSDGAAPLTPEEWGKSVIVAAPHLLLPSAGGGGGGGGGGNGAVVIDGKDPVAFGKNLEGIASGKVVAPLV